MMAAGMLAAATAAAQAAEHEVRMLNKGAAGVMVFEPALVRAAPGDTVRFVPADRSHNAETIPGMLPQGAQGFKGKMNEEVAVTLTTEGVYGVKCAPHYGMGMVALVIVGEPSDTAEAQAVRHPGKAKAVFGALFEQAVAAR